MAAALRVNDGNRGERAIGAIHRLQMARCLSSSQRKATDAHAAVVAAATAVAAARRRDVIFSSNGSACEHDEGGHHKEAGCACSIDVPANVRWGGAIRATDVWQASTPRYGAL